MCGIAGFINDKNISKDYIDSVTKQLSRRGPDYQESWLDKKRNFCFIHTRLSILDVSKNGNQPMRSQSGNILITFNGEIYNHLEIRHKIEKQKNGYNWRSSSDTETVVEAIDIYGLDETLKILDGMFAFCIYDYKKNVFFLARDKFGEKPLYYGFEKEVFLFGSDLSILKEHKSFKKELDYTAIDFFLKLSYIPAPLTIFKNFHKLNSGCYLEILYPKMTTNIVSYWSIEKNSKKIITNEITSQQKLVDNCNEILKKSVISRTLSDVPIGTFLSSGIDSSLITSLVKSHTNKSLDTFTLGYDDKYDDETKHAQLIAKQIGTNHNELKVSYDDILQTIEEIPNTYSEPFADSSQIPTMLISKFAKAKVSVVLTGDGGDEIFGGYNRHVWLSKLSKLSKVNKKIFLFFFNILNNFKLFGYKNESLKLKINKLIQILKLDNIQQMYLLTIFHDHDTNLMNDKLIKTHDFFNLNSIKNENWNDIEKMILMDTKYYLPDDILCKVDRGSMNYSLESRSPFLNQELFDFVNSLNINFKVKNNKNKYLLRKILEKYLPKNLILSQKKGFSIPLGYLIKTKLKKWSYNNIFDKNSFSIKNFNKSTLEKIWSDHQTGKFDRSKILWNIVTLNNWMKEWKI